MFCKYSNFSVNDTCLTESYSSLKYPCFYIGRCNYNEFFKTNTDGTKVKGSLKQSNTTTNETCFVETITDSITFSANITYDSNSDSSCAIKSGNIQTNVSFLSHGVSLFLQYEYKFENQEIVCKYVPSDATGMG